MKKKLFPNGIYVDWTQDAELAADLQKVTSHRPPKLVFTLSIFTQIGERLHEEYLAGKREERRRKNLQKLEDEAEVRSKKMQKRSEEDTVEVKAEDSGDDKDDIPLAQRLEMLTGKAKNGQVKAEEEHSNGVHTDDYNGSVVTNGAKQKFEDDSTMKSNGKAEEKAGIEEVEEVETTFDGETGEGGEGAEESVIEEEQATTQADDEGLAGL